MQSDAGVLVVYGFAYQPIIAPKTARFGFVLVCIFESVHVLFGNTRYIHGFQHFTVGEVVRMSLMFINCPRVYKLHSAEGAHDHKGYLNVHMSFHTGICAMMTLVVLHTFFVSVHVRCKWCARFPFPRACGTDRDCASERVTCQHVGHLPVDRQLQRGGGTVCI